MRQDFASYLYEHDDSDEENDSREIEIILQTKSPNKQM